MSYEITQTHLSQYITGLYEEEKSPHTIQKYFRDVKAFCQFTGNSFPGKESVLRWKEYLSQNYRPRSVNSMLASLNHFFSWMNWQELRVRFFRIQEEIYEREERELTKKEYEKLLRKARRKRDRRMEMLLQTLGATGIRVSELPYITVQAVKRGRAEVRVKESRGRYFCRKRCAGLCGSMEKKGISLPVRCLLREPGSPLIGAISGGR